MAATIHDSVRAGAFTAVFGDLECRAAEIPGFAGLWRAQEAGAEFATMGCDRFRKMTEPAQRYVVDCVTRVLGDGGVRADEVDWLVMATSDACLRHLGPDFTAGVLADAGLTGCVPVMLSFQQCCGSLAALRYAWELFADTGVRQVVLIALDFTPDDAARVRSFALFGDAVAGCLLSRESGREGKGTLRLLSSAVGVDPAGLAGRDSFASRQAVAQTTLAKVLRSSGESVDALERVFPANLYQPLTMFNAMAAGIKRSQLHFLEPMRRYAHCGNCDWIINLADYAEAEGLHADALYLAQSSAPGFSACGLLKAT